MKFIYSAHNLKRADKKWQRFFEILPGACSWSILLGLILLSILKPVVASGIVIAFLIYWLFRLFYMTIFLVLSYLRLDAEQTTDWLERVHGLRHIERLDQFPDKFRAKTWKQFLSLWVYRNEVRKISRLKASLPQAGKIVQLVIIPVAKEGKAVVEPGIKALLRSSFPAKQIIVVLAVENRAKKKVKEDALEVQMSHAEEFMDFLLIEHPSDLGNEAKVKGANISYAAERMTDYFKDKKMGIENVIVSCFDADTVVDSQYMACLTYQFMVTPERNRVSFQPIPVFNNNIWEAPGFSRILEMGSSFFQLIEATNPEKLVTFSSHSMSLEALSEIGYWSRDMISDDSSVFWKAYLHYEGRYRVVPLYVTLSMDVVNSDSWFKTAVSIYRQKRRWAWGVENFPILMRGFMQSHEIPLIHKLRHGIKMLEGHVSWATCAIILTMIGWMPLLYVGREFAHTVIYYSTPRIADLIFKLSTIALMTTIALSLLMLPKKKIKHSFMRRCLFALEWLLIPWVFVFLSAIPALDAQTRLMFGKYMEFQITEKKRKE